MRRWPFLAVLLAMALPQAAQAVDTIVFTSNRSGLIELYTAGSDGVSRLTFNNIQERQAVWSPDGSRIAFAGFSAGNWDIYTISSTGSDLQRLTDDVARDDRPKWTADGRIVFQRGPLFCPCEAWIMKPDGSGESLIPLPGNVVMPEPSPHGQRLAYNSDVAGGGGALWVAHLNGKGARRITDVPPVGIGDFMPRWSPNGNDLAFIRGDSFFSQNDLYVVHADGTDLRRLTETPGRTESWPAWSSDGSEVLFTAPSLPGAVPQRLLAVSLAEGTERAVLTSPTAPLVETFDDGVFDGSLWHEVVQGTGVSIGEVGGRLEVDFAAGAVSGGSFNQIAAHFGLQCQLAGDFELQVAYELLDWPAVNGLQAFLSGFTTSTSAQIFRESKPWGENYGSWIDPVGSGVPTSDTAGSLRMTRINGVVTTSYSSGGQWIVLNTGPRPESMTVGVGAGDFNTFSGLHVRVAFDNFRLDSGELSCPSWWSDREADVR